MLDWMSPIAFLQTMIRVLLVWSAFYWVGHMLEKPLRVKKLFPLLPKEITGILAMMVLTLVLSLFGIMNRTVTPIILLLLSLPGLLMIVQMFVRKVTSTRFSLYTAIFAVVFLAVALLNFTYASMPSLKFDDPLITYAVQPDRWLNAGRIHWLHETAFSGFPLTYEMTTVWPASLSFDRVDQLSLLQVFQMSMLLICLFRASQLMGIRHRYRLLLYGIVLVCTSLYFWCSFAKTDTMAIMFCTLALASSYEEYRNRNLKPYSSWLLMGLALATKQTAILVLIAFLPYALARIIREPFSVKVTAVLSIVLLPAIFAVRTMSVTGSPTYPFYQVSALVNDEWELLPKPAELIEINDRSSELYSDFDFSIYKHIAIYFTSLEGIFLLFIAGIAASLRKHHGFLSWLPVLAYCFAAIWVFWPPWWGSKYSLLIFPFIGILSVKFIQEHRRTSDYLLPTILAAAFIIPGFIFAPIYSYPATYRYSISSSVLSGRWNTRFGYRFLTSEGEGITHMWMNSNLTSDVVVLSLHQEKRYFLDHPVYVGWRHPATQELYLENTVEEECSILDGLGVDYVTFYRVRPMEADMENRIAILNHVGRDEILEPIAIISNGYLICRYNSPR